jgi:hypothetical protein
MRKVARGGHGIDRRNGNIFWQNTSLQTYVAIKARKVEANTALGGIDKRLP